jgi:hypothetical protein
MELNFELAQRVKNNGLATINLRIFNTAKDRKVIATDYAVSPADWDAAKQRVKSSHHNHYYINRELQDIYNRWEEAYIQNKQLNIQGLYNIIYTSNQFTAFIDFYVEKCKKGEIVKGADRVNHYKLTSDIIKEYEAKAGPVLLEHIDKNFFDGVVGYMYSEKSYQQNTVSKYISNMSFLMDEAREYGHKVSDANSRRWWNVPRYTPDAIALTENEMEAFMTAKVPAKLKDEQLRFTVAYFLLMRFGDSLSIDRSNFEHYNGKWTFSYRQDKTEQHVRIPVKPILIEMLQAVDFKIKRSASSEANERVKDIARIAKIKSIVNVGGVADEKWNFVTTHTARRSGATNLALQGVPLRFIMRIGGWQKESSLLTYIRMRAEDLEVKLKELDFYK